MNINQNITTEWVPIFREMSDKLLQYKSNRKQLIDGVYSIYEDLKRDTAPLQDKFTNQTEGKLKDICPFTIFGLVNKKMNDDTRTDILRKLAIFLQLKINVSEFNFIHRSDALPLLFPKSTWFFAFAQDRQAGDIDKLWDIFEIALGYADENRHIKKDDFIRAFDIVVGNTKSKGVKFATLGKLSMGLYWVRPNKYPTLDTPSKEYIYNYRDKLNDDLSRQIFTNYKKTSKYNWG